MINEVLNARVRRNKLEYLIKWVGYDNLGWERANDVNDLQVIDRFHELYLDKLGPLPEDLE